MNLRLPTPTRSTRRGGALALVLAILPAALSAAPTATRAALTLEGAQRVLEAALTEARKDGTGAIAIVDGGGYLMLFARLDNTFDAAPLIALGKARTSAMFRKPTKVFEDLVNQGRTTMVALDDFTPLQGGIPIQIGDQFVGAIGVSGAASAQRDEDVARAGAEAVRGLVITRAPDPADASLTHLDGAQVARAFAAGAPLHQVAGYKVNASRRDAPGEAEVHERDTDIMYVLDGSATLVTGGQMVAAQTVSDGEVRGSSIAGGRANQLAKGDVVVVPNGMPHWFSAVAAPFVYYVVKVTS